MASQDLLTLARQGDSTAVAAILNRVTEPKGIKVKVTRQERCLHVLLESDKALGQQSVVNFVLGSIKTLKIEPIETVHIYGRQVGNSAVAWSQEISLNESSEQPPSHVDDSPIEPSDLEPVSHPDSADGITSSSDESFEPVAERVENLSSAESATISDINQDNLTEESGTDDVIANAIPEEPVAGEAIADEWSTEVSTDEPVAEDDLSEDLTEASSSEPAASPEPFAEEVFGEETLADNIFETEPFTENSVSVELMSEPAVEASEFENELVEPSFYEEPELVSESFEAEFATTEELPREAPAIAASDEPDLLNEEFLEDLEPDVPSDTELAFDLLLNDTAVAEAPELAGAIAPEPSPDSDPEPLLTEEWPTEALESDESVAEASEFEDFFSDASLAEQSITEEATYKEPSLDTPELDAFTDIPASEASDVDMVSLFDEDLPAEDQDDGVDLLDNLEGESSPSEDAELDAIFREDLASIEPSDEIATLDELDLEPSSSEDAELEAAFSEDSLAEEPIDEIATLAELEGEAVSSDAELEAALSESKPTEEPDAEFAFPEITTGGEENPPHDAELDAVFSDDFLTEEPDVEVSLIEEPDAETTPPEDIELDAVFSDDLLAEGLDVEMPSAEALESAISAEPEPELEDIFSEPSFTEVAPAADAELESMFNDVASAEVTPAAPLDVENLLMTEPDSEAPSSESDVEFAVDYDRSVADPALEVISLEEPTADRVSSEALFTEPPGMEPTPIEEFMTETSSAESVSEEVAIAPPVPPESSPASPTVTVVVDADTPAQPPLLVPTVASSGGELSQNTQDWLKRPEAVVLILFVSLIMLWQMYLDFVEGTDLDKPLSNRELARRLGITRNTLSRRKDRIDFPAWTQDLDPDGIAWVHQNGVFVPRID